MPKESEQLFEYKRFVEDQLQISKEFLQNHRDTIMARLLSAHSEMAKLDSPGKSGDGEPRLMLQDAIYGINHCIHLASSLAVLGSSGHTRRAVDAVHRTQKLSHLDPTTVLTIATLYYLLHDFLLQPPVTGNLSAEDRRAIQDICHRFETVNWMIGERAMDALGIEKTAS